jgi:hypothetical protein
MGGQTPKAGVDIMAANQAGKAVKHLAAPVASRR